MWIKDGTRAINIDDARSMRVDCLNVEQGIYQINVDEEIFGDFYDAELAEFLFNNLLKHVTENRKLFDFDEYERKYWRQKNADSL